jgi:hypothetical protein
VSVQCEEQDEQPSNDDHHAYELAKMDSGPITTGSIFSKRSLVIIGIFPPGMQDARE